MVVERLLHFRLWANLFVWMVSRHTPNVSESVPLESSLAFHVRFPSEPSTYRGKQGKLGWIQTLWVWKWEGPKKGLEGVTQTQPRPRNADATPGPAPHCQSRGAGAGAGRRERSAGSFGGGSAGRSCRGEAAGARPGGRPEDSAWMCVWVLGRGVPGAVGSARGLWKRSREGEVSGGPARESVAGVGEREGERQTPEVFFFPSPEEGEGRF